MITRSVTIQCPGGDGLTVMGKGANRGFTIASSGADIITGLTIYNGQDSIGYGGAIYSFDGTLTLQSVTLSSNVSAQWCGALFTGGGRVTISDTTFSKNTATFGSSAASFGSEITMTNGTVSAGADNHSGVSTCRAVR